MLYRLPRYFCPNYMAYITLSYAHVPFKAEDFNKMVLPTAVVNGTTVNGSLLKARPCSRNPLHQIELGYQAGLLQGIITSPEIVLRNKGFGEILSSSKYRLPL